MARRGVPKGYVHNWSYRGRWWEKKIKPGVWKVVFRATKRNKSGRGGPKPGFRIVWGFRNVKQKAVKTGRGQYQTVLTAQKYVKKVPRRKKWR